MQRRHSEVRCLAIGAAVRHAYDGARGRVVGVDRDGAYHVRFDDETEDLVAVVDLRVIHLRRSPDGARPGARRRADR